MITKIIKTQAVDDNNNTSKVLDRKSTRKSNKSPSAKKRDAATLSLSSSRENIESAKEMDREKKRREGDVNRILNKVKKVEQD